MKKGLALDTSSYRLGVAISVGEEVVAEHMTNLKVNHALRLMPAVEALLNEVQMTPNELDYIAVAKGPARIQEFVWLLHLPKHSRGR